MVSFRERTRFASLVAIGLALLVSGVVTGAAGGNFILGQANSAGTSNTSLTTGSTGNALLVTQNGTGTAIRGSTGSGSGIAGFFTSGSGSGVSGVVANENKYGIYAANDSASSGIGAALRAAGKQNPGVVATSDATTAIVGIASCSTFFCGVTGVAGTGGGIFGSGVVGTGAFLGSGVYGTGYSGVFGTNSSGGGSGVYGSGVGGIGVNGAADGAGTIDFDCSGPSACWDWPGGAFAASIGVIGQTDTVGTQGYSRGVLGIAGAGGAWAMYSQGDMNVNGTLFVSSCTGCAVAVIAQNGSNQTIAQGDAVTLLGATTATDGSVVMLVGPAKAGDAVFGIADQSMALSPAKVTTKASTREVPGLTKEKDTVKSPSLTVAVKDRKWLDKGTSAKSDAFLRVITAGMLTYKADGAGLTAGDALAVGANAGKLAKADKAAARGSIAGKFGGKLKDGRIVIFVDPS